VHRLRDTGSKSENFAKRKLCFELGDGVTARRERDIATILGTLGNLCTAMREKHVFRVSRDSSREKMS